MSWLLPGSVARRFQLEETLIAPLWKDLKKMPWASRHSPHAKVVKDGKVIKPGIPEKKKS